MGKPFLFSEKVVRGDFPRVSYGVFSEPFPMDLDMVLVLWSTGTLVLARELRGSNLDAKRDFSSCRVKGIGISSH